MRQESVLFFHGAMLINILTKSFQGLRKLKGKIIYERCEGANFLQQKQFEFPSLSSTAMLQWRKVQKIRIVAKIMHLQVILILFSL